MTLRIPQIKSDHLNSTFEEFKTFYPKELQPDLKISKNSEITSTFSKCSFKKIYENKELKKNLTHFLYSSNKHPSIAKAQDHSKKIFPQQHAAFIPQSTVISPVLQTNKMASSPVKEKVVKTCPKDVPDYYATLNEREKNCIAELIHILSTTSLFRLNLTKIEQLGAEQELLHPLAIWKHIINHKHLKEGLQEINRTIVWPKMKHRYSESLIKQSHSNNLSDDIYRDFAIVLPTDHPFKDEKPNTTSEWNALLESFME